MLGGGLAIGRIVKAEEPPFGSSPSGSRMCPADAVDVASVPLKTRGIANRPLLKICGVNLVGPFSLASLPVDAEGSRKLSSFISA